MLRVLRRLLAAQVLWVLMASGACGQAAGVAASGGVGGGAGAANGSVAFEVVSVKPDHSGETGFSSGFLPGGDGYSAENISLLNLIRTAYGLYNVPDDEFEGVPKWARTERFDIVAKVPAAEVTELHAITRAQRGALLQGFLADRFKLRVHYRTKELPVYALVIAKNGTKLEEVKRGAVETEGSKAEGAVKPGAGSLSIAPGELRGQGADMWALKAMLTRIVGRTVLDKTGLKGDYDFTLHWTPDDSPTGPDGANANPGDSLGPSIFTALQEQLGLKLEAQRGPVEVLVIDQVELPSEN
ncbi:MAG: TIGR03435 family protein [Acidobacteriaceae bacterium]